MEPTLPNTPAVSEAAMSEADAMPSMMSSEELLAYWKQKGLFDTSWPQYTDIGPGKRFADSTEYVQHMRRQPVRQGK